MKKFISYFLVFAILLSLTPVYAIETIDDNYLESFCKHHPEHTEECGFSPGIEGLPCMHEHNSECYKEEIKCLFENVLDETENSQVEDSFSNNITNSEESNNLDNENILDDLGDTEDKEISNDISNEATDEIINEDINTDKENLEEINIEEDLKIDDEPIDNFSEDNNLQDNNKIMSDDADEHICSIESGCITLVLDCPHERGEHDDTCGYIEAQPSQECQFVCKICKLQEIIDRIPDINDFFNLDNNEMEQVRKDVYSAISLYEELTSEEASEIIGMDRVEELYMFLNASNSINGNEIELISATATESVAGGAEVDFTNNGSITIGESNELNIILVYSSQLGINNKSITINIPDGIELRNYTQADENILTNVSFIPNNNSYGSYITNKSGYLKYQISNNADMFVIELTVKIDTHFWDRQNNSDMGTILISSSSDNFTNDDCSLNVRANNTVGSMIDFTYSDYSHGGPFLSWPTQANVDFIPAGFTSGNCTQSTLNHAMKKVVVKFKIPYNVNTGEIAEFSKLEDKNVTYSSREINVNRDTLEIVYHDAVFTYMSMFPYFHWRNNQTNVSGGGKWGNLVVEYFLYNGKSYTATKYSYSGINSATLPISSNLSIGTYLFNVYNDAQKFENQNQVYCIGKFTTVNTGLTSGKVTLEFRYLDNPNVTLNAQGISLPTGGDIETIVYRTNLGREVNVSPDIFYKSAYFKEYLWFDTNKLNLSNGEHVVYIKAITNKGYEADYSSPSPGSGAHIFDGGSVIVNINNNFTGTINNFAQLTLTADGMSKSTNISANVFSMNETLGASIANFSAMSKNVFEAGKKESFNFYFSPSAYPYDKQKTVLHPLMYVRIPQGSSIEIEKIQYIKINGSISQYDSKGGATLNKTDYNIQYSYSKNGFDFYKITFNHNNVMMGAAYNNLYCIYGLKFFMNITFNPDLPTTSYNINNIFALYDEFSKIGPGWTIKDTIDFDNDGDTEEYISQRADAGIITVNAVRRGLMGLNSGGNVTVTSSSNIFDYTLNVQNYSSKAISASDAENFYYYIPIPKQGENWGSHLQSSPFGFSMNLTGPANITGTNANLFEVKYSSTVQPSATEGSENHYNNENNYVDASAVTNWDEIKMIRISVKNGSNVPIGATADVNVSMVADTINGTPGTVNTFNSCGFTQYTVGDAINSGHIPTSSTTITLNNGLLLGKLYIDNNKNGQYDDGIDSLYTDTSVSVDAVSANGIQTFSAHVFDNGTYEFGNLPAGTYTLTVSNPGSTDTNSSNPLKFLMNDGNISDNEMIYTKQVIVGNGNTTIATDIGFQRPFTVTFEDVEGCTVEYNEINVWMNDKISELPEIETNIDKRFENSWEYEDDKITSQELLDIIVTNNITIRPSLTQLYKVVFNGNGNTEGNVPPIQYLATGESILAPSGTGLKKDDDIFVGWTLSQENESFSNTNKEEAEEKIISQITINGYDIVVFAGYATDNNGNGTPDYNEETIKLYYNSNTEDIEILEEPTTITINSPFTLPTTTTFINGDYAFAGWSENPVDVVIDEEDANRANIVKSIVSDINKTVYAVWSKDDNKDGTPDYLEPQYHVNYVLEASFGTLDNSFECGHNHVTNTKEILMEKPEFSVNNAVFIGWSNYIFQGLVETETDLEDARIIKEVTFIDHDIEVYAVWGVDTNNDGNADVYEEHYNLIYNYNDGTNNHSKCNHIHVKNNSCDLTLSEPKITRENAVLIGWSLERIDSIVKNENEANQITLESILTFIDSDINIYAVWALDENNNKIPDYNEKALHVKYNSNSSKNEVITCTHHHVNNTSTSLEDNKFVYNGYVFVGWTSAPQDIIRDAETFASISFIGSVSFIEDDIDVYAAWAVDRNGNKIPDYNENEFFIIYHTNTENEDIIKSCGHPHLTLEKINISEDIPIPTQDGAKFLGWSLTQINHNIISAEEARTVKFEYFANFIDKNIEIYAVWAKDEDNNGIADYEDYCSITYDFRDGEYEDNRSTDTQVLYGTTITLPDGPYLTGYKFGGWRILGYEIVLSPGDKFTIKEDTVIQATWIKRQYSPDTDNNDKNENNDKIPEFIKPETPVSSVLDTNFEGPFMVGVSENSFEPDRFITRAEVAQIFYRLLKDKGNYENLNIFSDVPNNAWYKTAVNTLAAKGIIVGIGNSMFAPERYITRAEFCTIASRFAQTTSDRTNTYIDVNITDWFYPYVMNATGFGWVVGYNDYSFGPLNNLTRAEAATIVNRMLGRDDRFTNIIQKKEFYDVKPQYWWYQEILKATSFVSFG